MCVSALAVTAYAVTPPETTDAVPSRVEVKPVFGQQTPLPRQLTPATPTRAKAPATADYNGRKFLGAVVMASSWDDMSITQVPYGLYEFTISADTVTKEAKYTEMSRDWMGGAIRNGHFYGIRNINMFGSLQGVATSVIDINSWTKLQEYMDENPSYAKLPITMAYDFITGNIYSINYNEDLTGLHWVRFDPKTLTTEYISPFEGRFTVVALGAAPDGKMYTISSSGDLYTVDREDGTPSLVGSTGVNVASYAQSMAWDPQTNTFLWSAITPTGSALYSLNPTTGAASLIKRLSDNDQIVCIYPLDTTTAPGCPEPATVPEWNFSAPAADNGTITLTAPSAGELWVYLDGTAVINGTKVNAGQSATVPFQDLDNNTHHVSAFVKNDSGWSPLAESFRFVGLDVPLPVTDLTVSEADGTATVTWTAPADGVENGYIDPDRLYYRIVRIPDNITVQDHWTSTTYTETLPLGVKRYAYKVTPCNGGDKVGESTLSNSIIYGQAFEIPYVDNFEAEGAFDVYLPIDGDGDGRSWTFNSYNKQLQCDAASGVDSDNWLLSPKMQFESGKMYRVTAHTRNMWAGTPDRLAIGYCAGDNEDKAGVTAVDTLEINTPNMTLLDYTVDVTVPTTGQYKIALGMVSPAGQGGGLFISPLKVDLLGSVTAPAAPESLAITPDASKDKKATLSFKAPDTAIDGSLLDGSISANVYIDGSETAALTKTDIAPGSEVTIPDILVGKPGFHSFTLRLVNADGEGVPAEASAFIGIFETPMELALDTPDDVALCTYVPVGFAVNEIDPEMHITSWGDKALEVYHLNFSEAEHEAYIVLPQLRIPAESVLSLSYDEKNSSWYDTKGYEIVCGDEPKAESLSQILDSTQTPADASYTFANSRHTLVVPSGGDKYIALHFPDITNGYLDFFLRNVKVEYEGSALAPDTVTDCVAASALTSVISLKAPTLDYAGRPLASLAKVEIFRNGSAIAAKTFENPAPGESLSWTDTDALLGKNSYYIVASNDYGRGAPVTVESFIGYDAPGAIERLTCLQAPDNQTTTLSWQPMRRGVNGGVLDDENLSYTLVKINPAAEDQSEMVQVLQTGIKGTSIVPERQTTDSMEPVYYGICATTPQGTGEFAMCLTVLGRPYDLPFSESFANASVSTLPWVFYGNQNAGQTAMPTSPEMLEYNGYYGTCQDGDSGLLIFLNGAEQEYKMSFSLTMPKINLGGQTAQLSFWAYKGNQSGQYNNNPSLQIWASIDENNYESVGKVEWTETSPEWKQYSFSLENYADAGYPLTISLSPTLYGYRDPMLIDNIYVGTTEGVEGIGSEMDPYSAFGLQGAILTRGAAGKPVEVFGTDGSKVATWTGDDAPHSMNAGLYLIRFAGHTFKVAVR